MVSAGYDVRKTCDPMWYDTILAKFPRNLVKHVLLSNHTQDGQTNECLIGDLKKGITAKGFVENRLGPKPDIKGTAPKDKYVNSRPYSSDQCLFCHKGNHASLTCRTVTDQGNRRKILTDGLRCWKCCSSNHSSFYCQKPDCAKCGQKHHASVM
ncbi:unnamed protein product [Haemonchus placei]|uniref:Nucleic-acid-binding protein from transposon X-element n=1 Tax=Haemonchus placei TaxID=6290 RepID=A0A0N4WJ17_HAEPC|nr:unnamed protein product [Haemonchus placei]